MEEGFHLRGSEFSISTKGGPIDAPDSAAELFTSLGYAAACWGRMELLLDAILLHINKPSHSAKIYDPKHPVSFKRKIELLKSWVKKHPAYAQIGEGCDEAFACVKQLSGFRNDVFHGHIETYNPKTGEFLIRSMKFVGNDTFRLKVESTNLEKLRFIAEQSNGAHRMFKEMATLIFQTDGAAQPGK